MFDVAASGRRSNGIRGQQLPRVLDIGSGPSPHPWATHLADRYPDDPAQRFDLPLTTHGRPFIACSVDALPFADKSFDFIHCSHVLEHVPDPAAACRELMRVGRAGYIECPRSWTEYVFSAPDHRWLVDLEDATLTFREKTDAEADADPLGFRWSLFAWLKDPAFNRHWNAAEMLALRTVQLHWTESFRFVVIPKDRRGSRQSNGRDHPGDAVSARHARRVLQTTVLARLGWKHAARRLATTPWVHGR